MLPLVWSCIYPPWDVGLRPITVIVQYSPCIGLVKAGHDTGEKLDRQRRTMVIVMDDLVGLLQKVLALEEDVHVPILIALDLIVVVRVCHGIGQGDVNSVLQGAWVMLLVVQCLEDTIYVVKPFGGMAGIMDTQSAAPVLLNHVAEDRAFIDLERAVGVGLVILGQP